MIGETLQIGDTVKINIEDEARQWGYSPCPNDTLATVIGFSEIAYGRVRNFGQEPGIYLNCSWIKLKMEDGKEHTEWSGRLSLIDSKEQ